MLNEYSFKCIFKNEINDFILFKKSIGLKYYNEIRRLKKIDEILFNLNLKQKVIEKETFEKLVSRNNMNNANYAAQRTVVIHFCKYLQNIGFRNIYYKNIKVKVFNNYTPILFSKEEINHLFKTIDDYVKGIINCCFYNLYYTYSVMIRLLFACGIRVSEAIALKTGDVDFNKSTIKISHSKNYNSREIPMSNSMRICLNSYINTVNHSQELLFVNSRQNKIIKNDLEKFYKKMIMSANLNNKAVLHNLRHVFASESLRQALSLGYDEGVALVYMFKYMGHKSIKETEYYIHISDYQKEKILNYIESPLCVLYQEVFSNE